MSIIKNEAKTALLNKGIKTKDISKLEEKFAASGVEEVVLDDEDGNVYIYFPVNKNQTKSGLVNEFVIKQKFESFNSDAVNGDVIIELRKTL